MSLLTLVATPIGNLDDLSPRARATLDQADLVYAEDTRHTGRLLQRVGVAATLRSCHDHNEAARAAEIASHLDEGRSVALVTDAGTPGIADPGYRVVQAALAAGHAVTMVPGPSSILMSVVLSGFATDRFVFDGWLPRRQGGLRDRIGSYAAEERTVVVLESTHRMLKSLPVFAEILPDRRLAVCRELTKRFEEVRRGTATELLGHYASRSHKGEVVLVLEGADHA
jgi:16S rRNA (cytidine1402-2'-O)-methyltransferase